MGCVSPVKILKIVKIVWACGWGVGCVPLPLPSQNCENGEHGENGSGLRLGYGLCTLSENCENMLGLRLECRLCTLS